MIRLTIQDFPIRFPGVKGPHNFWPLPHQQERTFMRLIERCLTLDENEEFSGMDSIIKKLKL